MFGLTPYRPGRKAMANTNPWMDDFFKPFFDFADRAENFRVDIRDQGDHYLLEAELPGMEKDQLEIQIENGILTISANQKVEQRKEEGNYVYCERRIGQMKRAFALENVQQDQVSAQYENGILTMKLPKTTPTAQTSRRIDIT